MINQSKVVLASPLTPTPSKKQFIGSKVQILTEVGKSKFSVYLTKSLENKTYAMKIFPYEKAEMSKSYTNESRFHFLKHPNIIQIIETQNRRMDVTKGAPKQISYILMEYAPYGDFAELVMGMKFPKDEKLVRTYFQQLIDAIEYLHNNDVAHMDLKLENLLIGDDYILKVSDFDSSYVKYDLTFQGRGTENFRAPEVRAKVVRNPKAADIYSAGLILFTLMTGSLAYLENSKVEGFDLYDMVLKQDNSFWKIHAKVTDSDCIEDENFRKLFWSMVAAKADSRATISDIKKSTWYNGPIYSKEEVKKIMEPLCTK